MVVSPLVAPYVLFIVLCMLGYCTLWGSKPAGCRTPLTQPPIPVAQGNPGSCGAWVGLFRAGDDGWRYPWRRVKFKRIMRDLPTGELRFTRSDLRSLADGEYEAALMEDKCAVATSGRFQLEAGEVRSRSRQGGMSTPCVELLRAPAGCRPLRQRRSSLVTMAEAGGEDDDVDDERCFFDVPLVEVQAADPMHALLLKRLYRRIEALSYLDWGLTSDYDAAATQGRASRGAGVSPRTDRADGPRGLGGNTRGSEGYGELTTGSVQRLCALLHSLREVVLTRLRPEGWARAWDLTSESALVDVGSG